jgi:uncharacterized membrane protein YdjX (TVP38/TMEM64 family)
VVGSLGGSTLQYVLGRRLFTRSVDSFLVSQPALAAVLTAVRQRPLRLQLLIRLTPLNSAVTSYALGAIGVGFSRFAVACLALLPSLSLEVYFGYAGKHLARMAGRPGRSLGLHDLMLMAGLVVAIATMIVVSMTARKALETTTSDPGV